MEMMQDGLLSSVEGLHAHPHPDDLILSTTGGIRYVNVVVQQHSAAQVQGQRRKGGVDSGSGSCPNCRLRARQG